jgi:hypothetical protein
MNQPTPTPASGTRRSVKQKYDIMKLYRAVDEYVRSVGGNIIVAGGVQIAHVMNHRACQKYQVCIEVMGRLPSFCPTTDKPSESIGLSSPAASRLSPKKWPVDSVKTKGEAVDKKWAGLSPKNTKKAGRKL